MAHQDGIPFLTLDDIWVDSSKNIGIGTKAPTAKLEIQDGSVYPKSHLNQNSKPSDFPEGMSICGGYFETNHRMIITFKDSRGFSVFQIRSDPGANTPSFRTNDKADSSYGNWTTWKSF